MNKNGLPVDSQRVKEYFPLIHWVARKMGFRPGFHHQSGIDYDDAFQAGCVGLLRAFKKYNPKKPWREGKKANFGSYAAQCARWEMLEELDRYQWMRPLSMSDPEIAFGWSEIKHEGVKMDIDATEALKKVDLTEREDLVMEMHCCHGIQQAHIARLLGVSKPNVSLTLRSAKEKIAEAMH